MGVSGCYIGWRENRGAVSSLHQRFGPLTSHCPSPATCKQAFLFLFTQVTSRTCVFILPRTPIACPHPWFRHREPVGRSRPRDLRVHISLVAQALSLSLSLSSNRGLHGTTRFHSHKNAGILTLPIFQNEHSHGGVLTSVVQPVSSSFSLFYPCTRSRVGTVSGQYSASRPDFTSIRALFQ